VADSKAPGAAEQFRMAHVSARDGAWLCARIEGDGPTVLMLHEFASARACFAGFRQFFRGFRCVELFARGYAPSAQPDDEDGYSQAIAVDDCVDLLDALGVEKAHLVGVSMGASTALLMALRHPARVISATLMSVGGGGLPDLRSAWVTQIENAAARFETDDPLAAARAFLSGPSRRGLEQRQPTLFEQLVAELGSHPGRTSAVILRRILLRRPLLTELLDELKANETPILVISGTEDAHALAAGNYLLARNVEHVIIASAGHTPQLDQPDRVAQHTLRFLQVSSSSNRLTATRIGGADGTAGTSTIP
jgi:pimeloyl-ACP methyl ester carboxylesterase